MTKPLTEIFSERETAPENPAPQNPAAEPAGQPRDDHGRFASQQEQETAQQPEAAPQGEQPAASSPAAPPAQPQDGYVQIGALHAAREEARAAREQAQLAQQQVAQMMAFFQQGQQQPAAPPPPPVEPPDPFGDPQGWLKHNLGSELKPINERFQTFEQTWQSDRQNLLEKVSRLEAQSVYGREAVDTAFKALKSGVEARDPVSIALAQAFDRSPDPYGYLVRWHQTASPAAPPQQAQGQPQPQPPPAPPSAPQNMPSSFAAAANGGPRSAPAWSGPKPLSEIFPGR